jgi:hypothetical protein
MISAAGFIIEHSFFSCQVLLGIFLKSFGTSSALKNQLLLPGIWPPSWTVFLDLFFPG